MYIILYIFSCAYTRTCHYGAFSASKTCPNISFSPRIRVSMFFGLRKVPNIFSSVLLMYV